MVSKTKSQGFNSLFSCYYAWIKSSQYFYLSLLTFLLNEQNPRTTKNTTTTKLEIGQIRYFSFLSLFLTNVAFEKKLIVQLVEHTAHNGTDVGSNPAKLKSQHNAI